MVYMADVKDKENKRSRIMLDCIDAGSLKEAKEIASEYGTVIKAGSNETHTRCHYCGKIIKKGEVCCMEEEYEDS